MRAPRKARDGSYYTNVYSLSTWSAIRRDGAEPHEARMSRREVAQCVKNDAGPAFICITCAKTFRTDAGYEKHRCTGSEARHVGP